VHLRQKHLTGALTDFDVLCHLTSQLHSALATKPSINLTVLNRKQIMVIKQLFVRQQSQYRFLLQVKFNH
jgi:hypothetical protein